jgi:uncharacterized protein (DUF2062 family)
MRNFLRCRVLWPLLRLLRKGVSPRRLAWSLAVALVVGINPFLGLTTVSMVLLACVFKLNHVATQIGIHVVSPLQWLLFLPFIHIGIVLFRSHRLPVSRAAILHLSHRHPLELLHLLWLWEWHALIVWAVMAAILAPLMAFQIRRTLVLSMRRNKGMVLAKTCWSARLEMCQWRRETLDKESIWDEGRSTSLSRW